MDIFDKLEEDIKDSEKDDESEDSYISDVKGQLSDLSKKLTNYVSDKKKEKLKLKSEVEELIKSEVSKVQINQNVIERVIEKKVIEPRYIEPKIIQAPPAPPRPPAPPQIIKEVRVEVQSSDKVVAELKKKIEELEKKIEDQPKNPALPMNTWGFRTGKVIPSLSGKTGKYLRANGSKMEWASIEGGGTSSDAYSVSNFTTDRTLDGADGQYTLDELKDLVCSLITSLQGAGVIQ